MPSGQLVFVVSLSANWRVELTGGRTPRLCNFGRQRRSYGGAIAPRPCNCGKTNGPNTNADGSVDFNVGSNAPPRSEASWIPTMRKEPFLLLPLYAPEDAVSDLAVLANAVTGRSPLRPLDPL